MEFKILFSHDKWLKLSKCHDVDDHATKSSQARLSKQASNGRKKKYDESFLRFGFTFKNCNGYKKPVCLICNELLATESMKPSKLKKYLGSKHTSCANKPKEYFKRLLKSLHEEKKLLKSLSL